MNFTALKESFKQNWKSGISVALVSVPLSFSLAIASGASPMAGIITAVWAGLVGGLIGGSRFNIIGPAGALTGILIGYAILYGPAILPLLAIVSGIIILAVWLLKWDRYLVFVPSSVVHGFTLGVALTIAFGQLNAALGLQGLQSHESTVANIGESVKPLGMINWSAFGLFATSLIILFVLLKWKPRWPNAILVTILGIAIGYGAAQGIIPFDIQTIGTKYPGLSGNLFLFPNFSALLSNTAIAGMTYFHIFTLLIKASAVIAFVVILETLISAKTADGMTKTKFNQRREVFGVGLANIASGIFGGLPASGVFARTALNVKSGAQSSFSQVLNAIAVAIISIALIAGFRFLPLSITASILVYVSIRMVAREHFVKMYELDRSAFGLAIIVAGLTFIYDATAGIVVGALAALIILADKLSKAEFGSEIDPDNYSLEEVGDKAIIYRFPGTLTYLNANSHLERITRISAKKPIIFNFRYVHHIDVDGYEILEEIMEFLEQRNQDVYLSGVKPERRTEFKKHVWFKKLFEEGKIGVTNDDVMEMIG